MANHQNAATLGVALSLETGNFVTEANKAAQETQKLKNAIARDMRAADKEIQSLKYATEDYGKAVTKVTMLERELTTGRLKNLEKSEQGKEKANALRAEAAAYDAKVASMRKMNGVLSEQQKMQVGYQLTDFFTQIASGQNPMIAFIQQGGQLKDSMGGVGNAIRAITTVFTPFRIGMLGAAGALAAVAYAVYEADKEFDKFQDSLTLTGNYAGVTATELTKMSSELTNATGVTVGSSKEIYNALVSSGQFTEKSIGSLAKVIATYSKIAGVDAAEAAQKLIPSLDGSAAGAKRLNDQMNFLTLEQYKRIEALERSGKKEEAAKMAAEILNEKLLAQKRTLGDLEAAWDKAKKSMSQFWESFKEAIGGPTTTEGILKRTNEQIESLEFSISKFKGPEKYIQADKARLELLKAQRAELEKTLKTAEESKVPPNQKTGINLYFEAGGADKEKQIIASLEKSKYELAIKTAMETADEGTRIELEAAQKVQDEIAKYQAKSDKEKAVFGAKMYEDMMTNAQIIIAERNRKLHDYEKKRQWDKDVKAFEEETDIKHRLMQEFNDQMTKAVDTKAELETARKKLDLQMEMLGASERERLIAASRLDYEEKIIKLKNSQKFQNADAANQQALLDAEAANQALIESNIWVQDSYKKIAETSNVVWNNMSTMIDNFVKTGKLAFKDFAKSVIQELMAIQLKMATVNFLNQAFSAMGFGFQLPGRAVGGPVSANTPYMVGEKGPELFMPSGSGTIIPNDKLSQTAPVTNVTNNYINAIDAKSFEQRLLESNQAIWSANQYATKNMSTNFGRT